MTFLFKLGTGTSDWPGMESVDKGVGGSEE